MNEIKEFHVIAKHYGDDCSNCEEICCANMMLMITREDVIKIANYLNIKPDVFRKKYTILGQNYKKIYDDSSLNDPETQQFINKNPRLLKFVMYDSGKGLLPEKQWARLVEMSNINNQQYEDITVGLCPFFDKKTRHCKIYPVRPDSCRQFPFDWYNNTEIDLRNINVCALSTNFLKRYCKHLKRIGRNEQLKKIAEYFDVVLKDKKYHSHFPFPESLILPYVVHECRELNIPITTEILQVYEVNYKQFLKKYHENKNG